MKKIGAIRSGINTGVDKSGNNFWNSIPSDMLRRAPYNADVVRSLKLYCLSSISSVGESRLVGIYNMLNESRRMILFDTKDIINGIWKENKKSHYVSSKEQTAQFDINTHKLLLKTYMHICTYTLMPKLLSAHALINKYEQAGT